MSNNYLIDIIVFAPKGKITDQAIQDVCRDLDVTPSLINRDVMFSGDNFYFCDDSENLDLVIEDASRISRLEIRSPAVIHLEPALK